MTRPARFSQRDLTRAVKAAQAAGLAVVRTEITRDGRLILVHEGAPVPQPKGNSCDEVFGCGE
jgi:hypothetical protein